MVQSSWTIDYFDLTWINFELNCLFEPDEIKIMIVRMIENLRLQ